MIQGMKLLYIVIVIVVFKGYEENSFIRLSELISKAVNGEKNELCWVCTQVPPDAARGLSFIPWPIKGSNIMKEMQVRAEETAHQERKDKLHVLSKNGIWCFTENPNQRMKWVTWREVGDSVRQVYFNGMHFSKRRNFSGVVYLKAKYQKENNIDIAALDPTKPTGAIYWVCGTKAGYWVGSCYSVWLLPPTTVTKELLSGRLRNYRMLWDTSFTSRSTGDWKSVVSKAAAEAGRSIVKLSEELSQVRKMTLQNRIALDLLLAKQGGTYAPIRQRCCVYINSTSEETVNRAMHLELIAEDLDRDFKKPLHG